MKYKISKLEKILGRKIKKNYKCLGIDTASRTGWALITTKAQYIIIDTGFIDIDTKNRYFKFNIIIDFFNRLIQPEWAVIVEDTFYRFNPKMYRLISRIGAVAYAVAYLRGCRAEYRPASSARKNLGIKGNCKKKEVSIYLKDLLGIEVKDDDIGDAIVLALNGILVDVIIPPENFILKI